jgi:hypothetical protein
VGEAAGVGVGVGVETEGALGVGEGVAVGVGVGADVCELPLPLDAFWFCDPEDGMIPQPTIVIVYPEETSSMSFLKFCLEIMVLLLMCPTIG